MLITSFFRGHQIYIANGECFYSDTNIPTAINERKCGYCKRARTKEAHDGCLGTLPGVMNACCGHGVTSQAYVQYSLQNVIRGDEAIKAINLMRPNRSK